MWEFEDRFEGPELDPTKWLPSYLPQWSSRERAAARYEVGGGLRLLIEEDQPPWCPEWDGELRVSSLQTGVFAGPVGSHLGQQSAFHADAVVREAQPETRLHLQHHGRIETRLRAIDHPRAMVALEWAQEELAIDVREPHVYAADWTPEHVAFSVDGEHVKTVGQSPAYPMQLMLGVYELPGEEPVDYPHVFAVDYVRCSEASVAAEADPGSA